MSKRTGNFKTTELGIVGLALCALLMLLAANISTNVSPEVAPFNNQSWPGDKILYDLSVHSPEGELLFRPKILSKLDTPSYFYFFDRQSEQRLNQQRLGIHLDGLAARDGLDLSMNFMISGLVSHHTLRVRLPADKAQTIFIPTDDGRLVNITLRAHRSGSPAFKAYMSAIEQTLPGSRVPEA